MVGRVEVMAERVKRLIRRASSCPGKSLSERKTSLPSCGDTTYIVDAIDTVTAKIALIQYADGREIPVISAMGAGNKLDPLALKVADISKTHTCPLKAVRKGLRDSGITTGVKVVFSTEPAVRVQEETAVAPRRQRLYFLPPSVSRRNMRLPPAASNTGNDLLYAVHGGAGRCRRASATCWALERRSGKRGKQTPSKDDMARTLVIF